MSLLDIFTGGASGDAVEAQKKALEALSSVQTPTAAELTLPELQQYAIAQNMTPAQMQAFLQQNNALANENTDQTGTSAQKAAIARLLEEGNAGLEGSATDRAQQEQIQQDSARALAGQRGAIDQQAEARGVPLSLLQAALQQQNAGQGAQDAHMAALNAQSNNYQTALNSLANAGTAGANLQGQQNTQANTVAQAQNALQQFNAANQQAASAANAGYQQQANSQNTQNANQTSAANTGLANQRTQYNAQVPQQVFNNNMSKATGVANQNNSLANTYTGQGQQTAGLYSGLIGAGATLAAPQVAAAKAPQYVPPQVAHGGVMGADGRICMDDGGMVPGQAPMSGDTTMNDIVPANLSPGEAVIPRTAVQDNPDSVNMLMSQGQGIEPQDVATLLKAMQMLRGA